MIQNMIIVFIAGLLTGMTCALLATMPSINERAIAYEEGYRDATEKIKMSGITKKDEAHVPER